MTDVICLNCCGIGKYGEDFGMVSESENAYKGRDGACSTCKSATRYHATNYHYMGGYYGACTEQLMRLALVLNGPLTVSFQVFDDFMLYQVLHFYYLIYSSSIFLHSTSFFTPFGHTSAPASALHSATIYLYTYFK